MLIYCQLATGEKNRIDNFIEICTVSFMKMYFDQHPAASTSFKYEDGCLDDKY